jgi:hypothetical protein
MLPNGAGRNGVGGRLGEVGKSFQKILRFIFAAWGSERGVEVVVADFLRYRENWFYVHVIRDGFYITWLV